VQPSRQTDQKSGIHRTNGASSSELKPCKVWSGVWLLCRSLYPHSHELRARELSVNLVTN